MAEAAERFETKSLALLPGQRVRAVVGAHFV